MAPSSGSNNRFTSFSSVVLPAPLRPTSARTSPASTTRLKWSRIRGRPGRAKQTSRNSIAGTGIGDRDGSTGIQGSEDLEAHEERRADRGRRVVAAIERNAFRPHERADVEAGAQAFAPSGRAGGQQILHAAAELVEAARLEKNRRFVELPEIPAAGHRERCDARPPPHAIRRIPDDARPDRELANRLRRGRRGGGFEIVADGDAQRRPGVRR